MRLCIILIVVACVSSVVHGQQELTGCVTPENYQATCVPLSYCPEVVNAYARPTPTLTQYVFGLQRACGTRNVNGDPVICCMRPLIRSASTAAPTAVVRPSRQAVTQRQNPFLTQATRRPTVVVQQPTTSRNTRNPQTARPVITNPARPVTTIVQPQTSAPLLDNRARSCREPDSRDGHCVDIRSCPEILAQLAAKQNDPTFANYLRVSNAICGNQGSNVCCPTSRSTTTATSAPVTRNTKEIPRRLPSVQEGCGHTTNSYKKIVGGEVSKKGAWPWVALLGYNDPYSTSPFKCGGALVTARHVVTAAHCIREDLSFVRLGEHDLTTNTEAQHVDIRIVRTEKHPKYNARNGRSDIAILYLERNVQFNDFISPICMPITNDLRHKSYVNYTPFVVGWGKTQEGGTSANILNELQIPIYKNDVCRNSYAEVNRLFSADQFDSAVVCAGVLSGGKDTCQGDSGGPLMIPEPYQNSVRYYLIGVVSYGVGCARPKIPGVYTSTQYFLDWIQEKIADSR